MRRAEEVHGTSTHNGSRATTSEVSIRHAKSIPQRTSSYLLYYDQYCADTENQNGVTPLWEIQNYPIPRSCRFLDEQLWNASIDVRIGHQNGLLDCGCCYAECTSIIWSHSQFGESRPVSTAAHHCWRVTYVQPLPIVLVDVSVRGAIHAALWVHTLQQLQYVIVVVISLAGESGWRRGSPRFLHLSKSTK